MSQTYVCDKCGATVGIGQSPWCRDGHGRVLPAKGFDSFFDIGLGREVSGWGDIHQAMREANLDFRDHPSPGDLSARRDKCETEKKARSAA